MLASESSFLRILHICMLLGVVVSIWCRKMYERSLIVFVGALALALREAPGACLCRWDAGGPRLQSFRGCFR